MMPTVPPRSEFRVEVVRLGPIEKHPNADTLGITHVHGGYPVIVKLGVFVEGGLAAYIPIDAHVNCMRPEFARLGKNAVIGEDGVPRYRVRAEKLRGIFSMGFLIPLVTPLAKCQEGDVVTKLLDVERWIPPEEREGYDGEDCRDPGAMPSFGLESYRRYPSLFVPGEEVVVTEKIHGESARYFHDGENLWAASHTSWKRPPAKIDGAMKGESVFWVAAKNHDLEERLRAGPRDLGIYCEVYGKNPKMKYGATKDNLGLAIFAACDTKNRAMLDWDDVMRAARIIGVPTVPVLYRGPWDPEKILPLAEGKTTALGSALSPSIGCVSFDHVREGIVITPAKERFDDRVGRVALKLHGQGFLLGR